jgi:hypothetical protein
MNAGQAATDAFRRGQDPAAALNGGQQDPPPSPSGSAPTSSRSPTSRPALTKAWVDAWDTVSTDLETAINELIANAEGGLLSRAMILRSRRLQYALQAIAQKLDELSSDAGRLITDDLPAVVRAAGEAQEAIIASQLPKAELANWRAG